MARNAGTINDNLSNRQVMCSAKDLKPLAALLLKSNVHLKVKLICAGGAGPERITA